MRRGVERLAGERDADGRASVVIDLAKDDTAWDPMSDGPLRGPLRIRYDLDAAGATATVISPDEPALVPGYEFVNGVPVLRVRNAMEEVKEDAEI